MLIANYVNHRGTFFEWLVPSGFSSCKRPRAGIVRAGLSGLVEHTMQAMDARLMCDAWLAADVREAEA